MNKTIFAHTPAEPASYPPFINIGQTEQGKFVVMVRGSAKPDGSCSDTVAIELDPEKMQAMVEAIVPVL